MIKPWSTCSAVSTSRARRRPRHEHTAARVCLNTPRRVRARSAQTPGSKHHNFPSTGARSLQMARPAELPAPLQTRRRPLVEHRTGAGAAAPHVPWYTTALVSALAAARSAACAARGSVRHRVHPWPCRGGGSVKRNKHQRGSSRRRRARTGRAAHARIS